MLTQSPKAEAGYAGRSAGNLLRDFLACGMLTVDAQGRILALTPLAERLLSPDRVGTAGQTKILPSPVLSIVQEVLSTGEPVTDRSVAWDAGRECVTLRWGFVPSWSKDGKLAPINAMSETALGPGGLRVVQAGRAPPRARPAPNRPCVRRPTVHESAAPGTQAVPARQSSGPGGLDAPGTRRAPR